MRAGGSAVKGGIFERLVCQELSLWISHGQRRDLLERNVQSGGRFTSARKRGSKEMGQPSDIMAAHADAIPFTSLFAVECKHLASLGLESYIYDTKGTSQLAVILALAERQAREAEKPLYHMVVARQNSREIMLFVGTMLFADIKTTRMPAAPIPWHHTFHRDKAVMMRFNDFTKFVRPANLIHRAKVYQDAMQSLDRG